jgi:hypothetical protein
MKLFLLAIVFLSLLKSSDPAPKGQYDKWKSHEKIQEYVKEYRAKKIDFSELIMRHEENGFEIGQRQIQRYIKAAVINPFN